MTKIILDIFLIIFFIAVSALQVYVIFRIKELKQNYGKFMASQHEFIMAIEKARQSLMLVNSQAFDVLPELKKCIKDSDSLMQDFSFVLARANKKIDVLQELSSISDEERDFIKQGHSAGVPLSSYRMSPTPSINNTNNTQNNSQKFKQPEVDPVMARLARLEEQERLEQEDDSGDNFLKKDNSKNQEHYDLIEKALKEIV